MASLIGIFAMGASLAAFAHYQRRWRWSDLADYDPVSDSRGPIRRFFGRLAWGFYRGPDGFPPLSDEELKRVKRRYLIAGVAFFASFLFTGFLMFTLGFPPPPAIVAVGVFWLAIAGLDEWRDVNRWSGW